MAATYKDNGQLEKSLKFYDLALEKAPVDKKEEIKTQKKLYFK